MVVSVACHGALMIKKVYHAEQRMIFPLFGSISYPPQSSLASELTSGKRTTMRTHKTHRCTHRHTRAVQCETVSFYDIYDKRREIIPPTFFQKKRKSLSSSSPTTLNIRQGKQAQHSISRPDATKNKKPFFEINDHHGTIRNAKTYTTLLYLSNRSLFHDLVGVTDEMRECVSRDHFLVEMVLFWYLPTLLVYRFFDGKTRLFSTKHSLELFPMLLSVFSCAKKVSLLSPLHKPITYTVGTLPYLLGYLQVPTYLSI